MEYFTKMEKKSIFGTIYYIKNEHEGITSELADMCPIIDLDDGDSNGGTVDDSFSEDEDIEPPQPKNTLNARDCIIDLDVLEIPESATVEMKNESMETPESIPQKFSESNSKTMTVNESIETLVALQNNKSVGQNELIELKPTSQDVCIDKKEFIGFQPKPQVVCIELSSEDENDSKCVETKIANTIEDVKEESDEYEYEIDNVETQILSKPCDLNESEETECYSAYKEPMDLLEPLFVVEQSGEFFENPDNKDWGFKCKYCERIFLKKEDLRKEYLRHAQERRDDRKKERQTYICPRCRASFFNAINFKWHEAECVGKFLAKSCVNKRTLRQRNKFEDKTTHHSKKRKY